MSERDIPIVGPFLNWLIGSRNERFIKRYTQRVEEINALESATRKLTDEQLRGKLGEFRDRIAKGSKADGVMAEAFAVAREAMDRSVGIRNIFNPKYAFDPSRLSEQGRDLYSRVKAEAEALPVIVPRTFAMGSAPLPANAQPDQRDEYLGCNVLVPGWMQVDIPVELYEEVRALLPESRPPFRARPFDVQLIGGMVLCQGKISEMKTGEGKTIVAPLACYMASIERMKVHVVTVNDYLVQRDRDWVYPYFRALGMRVGAIHPQHQQDEDVKRLMYRCDVVYGTTSEFGFDYLRDNMKRTVEQQVQRKRNFAIVDEVDSILIDEARTPLIISGQAHEDSPRYELADKLARHLVEKQRPWNDADERVQKCMMRIKGCEGDIRQTRDKAKIPELQAQMDAAKKELPQLERERDRFTQYYEVKIERKSAHATHEGIAEAQRVAGIGSFYVDENIDMPHLLEQALRAHAVYELDKDYVVMPAQDPRTGRTVPSVVIVDVNTGRPMIGRQWSDGLHQAVECKERVPIKEETQTVATVTIQNFFKMYKRLAGMTGTADTEAQEFHDIYELDVVQIPTNKSVVRRDFDDMIFLSAKDKWSTIVDELKAFNDVGRPVLVGTTSVEKSESLSKMLTQRHAVQHEVLNAKPEKIAREAEIVENAGQLGSVMIATNMAGRGTDIKLGQVTRETLLDHWLRRGIAPRTVTVDSTDEQLREGVYRKIAPRELEIDKRAAEGMPFAELELQLLRRWAATHTWETPGRIESASAEELRGFLDRTGRFLLHRLRWFESVEDMGGLHVIGTERHEARRIDNQLRGRSGRQGDKGSSRFFVSLEDDLMKLFAGETTMKVLSRLGMKEGDAIEHPMLSKSVERAQKKVEERNFQYRKTVLEYDEVMEHQRRAFYGLRQRVLEGRDVKGLIFEFIRDTVDDAADTYLDPDYPAICAAEFAKGVLDCSIPPERLRGKEIADMESTIVEEALYESRQTIGITIGEYLPDAGSEASIDFDAQGLANWAKNRFGVEFDAAKLGESDRRMIVDELTAAAERAIRAKDLSGLAEFVRSNYGAEQLVKWVKEKLDIDVKVEDVVATHKSAGDTGVTVTAMLMKRVEELYAKREVEYPVDFAVQYAQLMMRQNPQEAIAQMIAWAKTRYGINWTPEDFKTMTPQKFRNAVMDGSRAFVADGRLEKAINDALACPSDEALEQHLMERYGANWPESSRYLEGEERTNAVRARVENILRAELLQFERTILIETLDSNWKDHLYSMDQLRDSINFRAFSQQDPRTEYKREGSQLFLTMMKTSRERVTEFVFRARLTPQLGMPSAPRPAPVRPPMSMPPAGAGVGGGAGIVGPGLS